MSYFEQTVTFADVTMKQAYELRGFVTTLSLGYILGLIPSLLFGKALRLFASVPLVLLFSSGLVLGAFGLLCAILIFFYLVTIPRDPLPISSKKAINAKSNGKKAVHQSEHHVDITEQGPSMPHAVALRGRFQGVIYTVPMSKWKRTECVLDWPPVQKPFKAWFAEIDQGTLVLKPMSPVAVHVAQRSKSGSLRPATESLQTEETLGIPLEGCSIDIVRDGLKGRSDYLRRAPLLISNDRFLLMDGEHGFYLFAEDPCSKLQWVSSLRYWSVPQGDANDYCAVQDMYAEYCSMMRSAKPLTPYMAQNRDIGGTNVQSLEPLSRRRGRWRPWKKRREFPAIDKTPQIDPSISRLDSLIDHEWMENKCFGKQKISNSEAPVSAQDHTGPINDEPAPDVASTSGISRHGSLQTTPFASPVKQKTQNMEFRDKTGDRIPTSTGEREHWPAHLPSKLYTADHFVNDLLLRSCFDFVRNPDFADAVRSRVQLQLDRMHTPEYVQSLTVLDVDLGSSAPSVSNFSSLPSPEPNAHMPQIIFDMKYEGNFSITLECKVDIRDAKGWGALDRALDAIEGRPQTSPNAWNGTDAAEIDLLKTVSGFHGDYHPDEMDESSMTPENSGRSLTSFDSFRQGAAQRLRKIADSTAAHISKIPLRVQLTFSSLEGPMCVWIPPPPGDRVFWSFLTPPRLNIAATPQIGDRVFKYAYHASRASQWIEARMKLAFSKNLVFPSGGDFRIPGMLSVDMPIMYREGESVEEDTSDGSLDATPASSSSMHRPEMSPSPFFKLKLRRKA